MTEQEARAAAQQARRTNEVPPEATLTDIAKRYIELAQRPPLEPGPVRDVLVWIAHFQQGIAWVELAIEDLTGRVVRREQSRQGRDAVVANR